jgi:biopolymer transport protein ExbD
MGRSIELIILDDMKMNLIAALIVLVLGASFTNAIELPFKLAEVEKSHNGSGAGKFRSTKILLFKQEGSLVISMADEQLPVEKAETLLRKLNPGMPVTVAVEKGSGLSYDELVRILAVLKSKGVRDVSLLAEGT